MKLQPELMVKIIKPPPHRRAKSAANVVSFDRARTETGSLGHAGHVAAAVHASRGSQIAQSEMLQTIVDEMKVRLAHLPDPQDRNQRIQAIQTVLDNYSDEIANLSDTYREGLDARVNEYENPPIQPIKMLDLEPFPTGELDPTTLPRGLTDRDQIIVDDITSTINERVSQLPTSNIALEELSDDERIEVVSQHEEAVVDIIASVLEERQEEIASLSDSGRQYLQNQIESAINRGLAIGNWNDMIKRLIQMLKEMMASFQV